MFRFDSNQWSGIVETPVDFWRAVDDLIRNGYSERDALAYLLGQPERTPGVFGYFNMDLSARPFRGVCPPEWLTRPATGDDT